jgi:redox-sensitive bicupin YhaK (pirin superfamily)
VLFHSSAQSGLTKCQIQQQSDAKAKFSTKKYRTAFLVVSEGDIETQNGGEANATRASIRPSDEPPKLFKNFLIVSLKALGASNLDVNVIAGPPYVRG